MDGGPRALVHAPRRMFHWCSVAVWVAPVGRCSGFQWALGPLNYLFSHCTSNGAQPVALPASQDHRRGCVHHRNRTKTLCPTPSKTFGGVLSCKLYGTCSIQHAAPPTQAQALAHTSDSFPPSLLLGSSPPKSSGLLFSNPGSGLVFSLFLLSTCVCSFCVSLLPSSSTTSLH